jgi:thiol-disulfide isomerase/thioredoxin
MSTTRVRVRAAPLRGDGGWLNTGGVPLTLPDLRGKVVLLDFWTFCCINCLHVIDELRPLEERYAHGDDAVLVVVGVHSPKFTHEADHAAVTAAVERYGITHPVLDDPTLTTWDAYAARAWPTLVVIDPEGYVVAQRSGEGHAHGLETLVDELVREHEAKGTLRRGPMPAAGSPAQAARPDADSTLLRYPGKAIALPDAGLLVCDSGRHRLVELDAGLETIRSQIGSGERGLADGPPGVARFNEPQGLCLLPKDVAQAAGYDVVIADTVNHALRGVGLADHLVTTAAGTGTPRMSPLDDAVTDATATELSSPWDVVWWPALGRVVVAMAGVHQLAVFDPVAGTIARFAGTAHEGLVDGPLADAWFAQPSGLAVDGDRLWIADSENSALRVVESAAVEHGDRDARVVRTAIGTGLFTFGVRDGDADQALLQHPLGLGVLPDGSIAIADTYNGAIRRYDPASERVTTLATELAEPSDVMLLGDHLVVVEANAHRVVALPLPAKYLDVEAREFATRRSVTEIGPGLLELTVQFTPPTGQHLDDRFGTSTALTIDASPPELIADGAGAGTDLTRTLTLAPEASSGVLHVTVRVATCDDGESEHAACHIHQQDWGIPVRVVEGGPGTLELMLRAVAL